jgi:hypothetical protein
MPSKELLIPSTSTPIDWSGEESSRSFLNLPTMQAELTIQANIPTFDPSTVITFTPSPPGLCPDEDHSLALNIQDVLNEPLPLVDVEKTVLDFLNAGGAPNIVIGSFFPDLSKTNSQLYFYQDVTGDNVSELAISYGGYLSIFQCKSKMYTTALKLYNPVGFDQIYIRAVTDMNLDGIPEIVLNTTTCNSPCTEVRIIEWDGNQFRTMLREQYLDFMYDAAQLEGGKVSVHDVDGNGNIEVILTGGIPTQLSALSTGFPYREETKIYSWNGMFYVQVFQGYSPPEYRFQAVQDGDRASLAGEYDQALDYYQQVIFSDKLEWWSIERRKFLLATEYSYFPDKTSTPPAPDPGEYYNLAAYARYRIMLLHIVRGWLSEAQIVYDTLQKKFPDGNAGHAYSEMSTAFWEEYQDSQNIGMACNKAIKYAEAHQSEILVYLGNIRYSWDVDESIYFGVQSLIYEPQDICPFK